MMVVVTLSVGSGRAVGRGNCRSASLSAGSLQPNRLLYDDLDTPFIDFTSLFELVNSVYLHHIHE